MKVILCYWQIICLVALTAAGCRPVLNMQKDMVNLDAKYIPVMIVSYSRDYEKLRLTTEQFHYVWMEFKQKHEDYPASQSGWNENLAAIGQQVSDIQVMLKDKRDFGEIQQRVLGIRPLLCKLRQQADVDYYLDTLIEFDQLMGPVYSTVKNKTRSTLTRADMQAVSEAFTKAQEKWDELKKQDFDGPLFGFDTPKTEVLANLIQEQNDDMLLMEDALRRKSRKDTIAAGRLLQPNCNRIFWLFGDFSCLSRQFRSADDD